MTLIALRFADFSGCVCHLEQLHAQSPFLFPIVFGINGMFCWNTRNDEKRLHLDMLKHKKCVNGEFTLKILCL